MGVKNSLDAAAISSIIESCAKHGVRELKFSELQISFGSPVIETPLQANPKSPVAEITDEQHENFTKDAIRTEELSLREQQLESALLENPALYEELLQNGDVDDDEYNGDE